METCQQHYLGFSGALQTTLLKGWKSTIVQWGEVGTVGMGIGAEVVAGTNEAGDADTGRTSM